MGPPCLTAATLQSPKWCWPPSSHSHHCCYQGSEGGGGGRAHYPGARALPLLAELIQEGRATEPCTATSTLLLLAELMQEREGADPPRRCKCTAAACRVRTGGLGCRNKRAAPVLGIKAQCLNKTKGYGRALFQT